MLALLFAASISWGGFEDFPDATPEMRTMPLEVRTLIERRAYCNHWWGEPVDREGRTPEAQGRARQIDQSLRAIRCDTVEREERRLQRRFARIPAILKALDETRDWLP